MKGMFVHRLRGLMVLSAQSRDDNSEELLPGSLLLRCEGDAHAGGNHDGQAIGKQLKNKITNVNNWYNT